MKGMRRSITKQRDEEMPVWVTPDILFLRTRGPALHTVPTIFSDFTFSGLARRALASWEAHRRQPATLRARDVYLLCHG